MNLAWIEIKNLASGFDKPLHEPISCEFGAGKLIGIAGNNGSGKSTLIRTLLGLAKPVRGQIIKNHAAVVGYQPQENSINTRVPLTGSDLLAMQKTQSQNLRPLFADFLSALDTKHLLNTPLRELSGGEKQRLLLTRALLANPDLLIFDEPDNHLDKTRLEALENFIKQSRQEKSICIVLTSHRLLALFKNIFDQIIELNPVDA